MQKLERSFCLIRRGWNMDHEKKKAPHFNNVVLFPNTLDYYQMELTNWLENERYDEAMALLQWLLQCSGQEKENYAEWDMLLSWLKQMNTKHDSLPDEQTEQEMASEYVTAKQQQDADYAHKLLNAVIQKPLSEHTLFALEQLVHFEFPLMNESLIQWLVQKPLHGLLQFKVLQTLRRRGEQSTLVLTRNNEQVTIEINAVPLSHDEFPSCIGRVADIIVEKTEIVEPNLFYFAKELWFQYITTIYGTNIYLLIISEEQCMIDIWAAALHMVTAERLGMAHTDEWIKLTYAITTQMEPALQRAYGSIMDFISGKC